MNTITLVPEPVDPVNEYMDSVADLDMRAEYPLCWSPEDELELRAEQEGAE
jgi:hypothetical protein